MKKLLTGNEAMARGAFEAGVHYAVAYPGTPSTEILENMALYEDIYSEWAPNEKVALETAIGASLAGARALASMKHVGVNVAADPLFTFSYMGVNGGMVLITADEPGMHSSQNEQDNRNYARFAKIPMLEPSNSQEAKEYMKVAYEISEKYDTPVLYRVTTRVCHSKGIVTCEDRNQVSYRDYEKNIPKNSPTPIHSRQMRHKVESRMLELADLSEKSELNQVIDNKSSVGIIASGCSYVFAREVFGNDASYFKLGFSYPLPIKALVDFSKSVEKVIVIEENDPLIENALKQEGIEVIGKDVFPYYGEMTPDVIRKSYFGKTLESIEYDESKVVPRPPTLCAGCPHRGFFYELGKRKNTMISGDIGCYGLAFAEPYNAMDMSLCMGASLSMGHGAQKIFNMKNSDMRVVSVLGDSTFFHTGINSLLTVAYNNSNTINVVLDNRITGMTGHQENPGTGYTLNGDPAKEADIEALVRATGIEHVMTIDPNNLEQVKKSLDWAYAQTEPCVIITRFPCVLKKFSDEDKVEFKGAFTEKCHVLDSCIGCKKCLKTGCPALSFIPETKKVVIDRNQCVACEVCAQVCPVDAIEKEVK
ncbi:indolepyruvate ferredoxin oxidoreductase subunit alpha [Acidaminobacter sp. JC074]|uniref:indolepyruvate ferredoxin oxidoreductase subunit alpha n=1 Tax=Acidaminobacter sp. JC074 TaxID=2530199 RepID=UPI001F0D2005|nr:indolepyruvate ferredoxin oxidoreductase subunit alpha [Acidaminobacter sp. JC074]MCH4886070.1 indolepyruvate ferredoxin oxidoreductase subunit alpha [Acidaminobacter sp. JC074]